MGRNQDEQKVIRINALDELKIKELIGVLKSTTNIEITLCNKHELMQLKKIYIGIVLQKLGIKSNLKGYLYLQSAIEICQKDRCAVECVTKKLYPMVATQFGVDSNKVEHAMRHALTVAWQEEENQMQKQLFQYSVGNKKKPTNSSFIATVTDYINNGMIS